MNLNLRHRRYWKTLLALVWLVFTISLVCWWWFLALRIYSGTMSDVQQAVNTAEIQKHYRMFFWEGAFLIATIFVGGAFLTFLTFKDEARHALLRSFFANFSHDIKTSIARLRLQTDILREDNQGDMAIERLVGDVNRLDLQLENSMWIAQEHELVLSIRSVALSLMIAKAKVFWPELEITLDRDASVLVDDKVFQTVLRNLFSNSVLHGQATQIKIKTESLPNNLVRVSFVDNGIGLKDKTLNLGESVLTQKSGGGNGFGLYLTNRFVKRMHGEIRFASETVKGMNVELIMPGKLV